MFFLIIVVCYVVLRNCYSLPLSLTHTQLGLGVLLMDTLTLGQTPEPLPETVSITVHECNVH